MPQSPGWRPAMDRCLRCDGLMVPTGLVGVPDSTRSLPAWRCVNCGDVVDFAILQHRTFRRRGVSGWLTPEDVCAAVVRGRPATWGLLLLLRAS